MPRPEFEALPVVALSKSLLLHTRRGMLAIEARGGRRYVVHFDRVKADL
jgi:hypothetical protein